MTAHSLTERGFILPAERPQHPWPRGHLDWDAVQLHKVILDFLRPEVRHECQPPHQLADRKMWDAINADAEAHGFGPDIRLAFGNISSGHILSRRRLARYMGLSHREIWPHSICWEHEAADAEAVLDEKMRSGVPPTPTVAPKKRARRPYVPVAPVTRPQPVSIRFEIPITRIRLDDARRIYLGAAHVSAPAPSAAPADSPWRRWVAATRDLLRWWWSLVA